MLINRSHLTDIDGHVLEFSWNSSEFTGISLDMEIVSGCPSGQESQDWTGYSKNLKKVWKKSGILG